MMETLASLDAIEQFAIIGAFIIVVGVFLFLFVLIVAVMWVAKIPAAESTDDGWRVEPSDVV